MTQTTKTAPEVLTLADIIQKRRRLWNKYHSYERDREFIEAAAERIVSDENLRREVRREPYLLIEAIFTVVDKNMKTVPFFLNEVQRDFMEQLKKHGTEKPYLILKGRQQGFTTVITAYQLACSITQHNFFGFTVADCNSNTLSIFNDKARSLYGRIPKCLKPREKFNSARELFFDKLNSSWRIATASKNIGRSKTLNFLHYSEAAMYTCGLAVLQASVGSAAVKGAFIVYESTANGFNEFRELWNSGTCVNLFYEWWRTSEYRSTAYEYIDKADAWLRERLKMLKGMGLDREQLAWYAEKYDSYIDKRLIQQEFPCSPEEAFLSTGACIFDLDKLNNRMIELARQPRGEVGEFVYDRIEQPIVGRDGQVLGHEIKIVNMKFVPRTGGMITLHKPPAVKKTDLGDVYAKAPHVLGADEAGEGSDFCTAKVINNITGETVATLRAQRMDEDLYAEQCYCLGMYYNEALIAIETNYSRTPTRHLQALGYPNMYLREKMTGRADEVVNVPGFETNTATRPIIIDELVKRMRENPEWENDMETLRECTTFVRHENGKKAASVGAHDDLVMALAIANHIRGRQSYTWAEVRRAEPDIIEKFFTEHKKPKGRLEW